MKILFLTQYFPPETGAAQNRISNLARRLALQGNTVTVLTAMPNYPKGEIFTPFRGHILRESTEGELRVVRTWIYATRSCRFLLRILSYMSFVLMAATIGSWKIGRQDFVILESPPLFLGLAGLLISRLKRARLVMNVSDLWPESALALGILSDGYLLRLATMLEEYLYRESVFVTGQTEGIVQSIHRRFPEKTVVFQPNGISKESLLDERARLEARQRIRKEFGLTDFVVAYAGLHGLAQGLETVLEAASLLKETKEITFVFFGDGPDKQRLVQLAEDRNLSNVRFYPSQPAVCMPEIFAALDAALIPLKQQAIFLGALPSKLFESMGAGLPMVVSIRGEAQTLVDKAKAGICVEPEDALAMANAILRLCGDKDLCRDLGEKGRRYVAEHFDRAEIADNLGRLLVSTKNRQDTHGQCAAVSSTNE